MAYLLAEAHSSGALNTEGGKRALKLIGTFGSEDVFTQRGRKPSAISPDLHFFIVHGDGDEDAVVDSKTCAKSLRDAGAVAVEEVAVPGLGHSMPPKEQSDVYRKLVEALQRAQQGPTPEPLEATPFPATEPTTVPDTSTTSATDNLILLLQRSSGGGGLLPSLSASPLEALCGRASESGTTVAHWAAMLGMPEVGA